MEHARHHKSIAAYLEKYYFPILSNAGLDFFQAIPYYYPTPVNNISAIVHKNITTIDISDTYVGVVNIIKAIIRYVNVFTAARWSHYSEELKMLKNSSEKHFIFVESRFIYEKTAFYAFFGPPELHPWRSDSIIAHIKLRELRTYKDAKYRYIFSLRIQRGYCNSKPSQRGITQIVRLGYGVRGARPRKQEPHQFQI